MGIIGTLFGCKTNQPLETVASVDVAKYTGRWYEIASIPQVFEKGCSCVYADYGVSGKKYLTVVNSAYKAEKKKNVKIRGKAFVVKGSNFAKLKVQFFWPFRGDYWIIELADDYSYAAVGDQGRKTLWILARDKVLKDETYNKILEKVKLKGFDVSKVKKMDQSCK